MSDPFWFQALGCVLGFDRHSSGLTTVVTGLLYQALSADVHGIPVARGKGEKSTTTTKDDIPKLAEKHYDLSSVKINDLLYASRMAAKVDNAAIQDGYSLYHHVILFDQHAPVKYNFAHGGKDGVPYPVAREVYDKSIKYLSSAIEGAEIERIDRIQALKKLAQYSARISNTRDTQSFFI